MPPSPIGTSPLDDSPFHIPPDARRRHLAVFGKSGVGKTTLLTNWGPQTEYLLTNFCYGLLDSPSPVSLAALSKLLSRPEYRQEIALCVHDPSVKDFFHTYDSVWRDDQRTQATAPLLNKIGKFATNPIIRAVVGQHRPRFSVRQAMDTRKIILCDLSKGALGEDVSSLLGSLLTTTLYLAALSRGDVAEDERIPHFFYIDEVHNFTLGVDLASILSEARKYRLNDDHCDADA